MPAAVERCVESLTAKWKRDPSSRPKPKEKDQDAKSQAWAICQAAQKKAEQEAIGVMLGGDGFGPTLIAATATIRPYLPMLEESKVEADENGKEWLIVNLGVPGHFAHPSGPFVLNNAVFNNMIGNFHGKVVGQKVAYDCRHKPEFGAFGWFEELYVGTNGRPDPAGKRFYGRVDPTPVGLEKVKTKEFLYSSMEFHRNYKRDDVVLDLERATDDFCIVLEQEEKLEEETMPEKDENVLKLEQELEQEKNRAAEEAKRAKEAQEQADQMRLELDKAREQALALENQALESSIEAVISLAENHRDEKGNALPRPLIDWLAKFLRLEEFGEGEKTVKLSEDSKPPLAMRKYMLSAVKHLIPSMPGQVPATRLSQGGKRDEDEEDEFDYSEAWEG